MRLKAVIIRNLAAGWLGRTIAILTTLVLTPVLIKHFGKFEYGLWVAIGQGASLLLLLDMGIGNTIARFVSKAEVLNEVDETNRVFSSAMAVFLVCALLALVLVVAVVPFIPDIFRVEAEYHSISIWLFVLAGIGFCAIFPLRVGRGLLQSKDRYDIAAIAGLVNNVVRLVIFLLIFGRGIGDLLVLAVLSLALNLSTEIVILVIALRAFPNLKFSFSLVTLRNLREMFSLGTSALVQSISGMLYTKALVISAGIIVGVAAVPFFSIPSSLVSRMGRFIGVLGATFVPIASRMAAKSDDKNLVRLNVSGVRYGLGMSIPVCVYLLFYSEPLFSLWLGRTGLAAAEISLMVIATQILVVPLALGRPHQASRSILMSTNHHWWVANVLLGSSVIGFLLGTGLMVFSSLGIIGAAIGWSIRVLISEALLFPIKIAKYLKVSLWFYLKRTYGAPLVSGAMLSAVALGLNLVLATNTLLGVVLATVLFFSSALLFFFFLVLSLEDRQYAVSLLFGLLRSANTIRVNHAV